MTTRKRKDPRDLLTLFLRAAKELDKPYAVGGALAMAAHGYSRETKDVDAFVEYDDRVTWVRALCAQGLDVRPLFTGVHYVASLPNEKDPERRIDLLVPAEEPALSAISAPDDGEIFGHEVAIFPLNLLVIAKFDSDRGKDIADVEEMYERGMFDPDEVFRVMQHVDRTLAIRFRKMYGPRTGKRRRK